ncbi:MAG: FtsX-like permease family protein [Calditrichaeota bacterium]|nr:FtsX-like permease family protein [Calditrichota bacterium]
MKIFRLTTNAFKGLGKNKMRSFLMMVGIIIGIATLIVILSVTQGANKKIMARINNFGPNAIMVHSGGGKMRGPSSVSEANLTQQDLHDISSIDGVKIVTPFQVKLNMPIKYQSQFTSATVMGVMPDWADAWKRGASKGNFVGTEDVELLKKVCVIGQTVKKELFADINPIGAKLLIGKVKFKVQGILQKRGASPGGSDFDNLIIIPFSTASRRLMNQPKYIAMMRVIVDDPSHLKVISRQIGQVLRHNHHLASQEEDDFRLTSSTQIIKMIKGVSNTLHIFLLLISGLSLIIGGIVIMNIMLISVSERKKEIGLRKAVGARSKEILLQFVLESLVVTLSGGILGFIVGILGVKIMELLTNTPAVVSWEAFVLAFGFSFIVGIVFGVQPARKAARLDPVEALR